MTWREERYPITPGLRLVTEDGTIRVEMPKDSESIDLDHAWMLATVLRAIVKERRRKRVPRG